MWLSTTWSDFLYRRRAMGMMWLFPHDVTWARRSYYALFAENVPAYLTFSCLHGGNVPLVIPLTYLFWMGGTFVFFIWWFGMKKACGGAGSSALHVVVNDGPGSCAWQLMNQGSFGGSFGGRSGGRSVVFSALVFICLFLFPECVARVPVSLWGSGGWGCVRSTLRSRSQPSATVRNRPQPFVWGPYGRVYGKFCRSRDHFWRFQTFGCFVSRGRRGTYVTFSNVLYRVENRFEWQGQYFCDVLRRCVADFVAGAAVSTCPSSFCVAGAAL